MAQYDLRLVQNTAASGTEFEEKYVNVVKGGLVTSNATGVPSVLAVGANGKVLKADSAQPLGVIWDDEPTTHDQNTDTGTTQSSFQIRSQASGGRFAATSATKMDLRNAANSAYIDFQAKIGTFESVTLPSDPSADTDAANRGWVLAQITANAALQFKGTIGAAVSDTITIADFNALQTYDTGWLYIVNQDGTIRGIAATVGDWFIATETRTGSGSLDADWTHVAFDTSDFVTGPAGAISTEAITVWDSNNRKVKSSGVLLSALATVANLDNYIPEAIISEHGLIRGKTDGVPENFVVGTERIVGRAAAGTVRDLAASDVRTIINVEDGANNYTHPTQTAITSGLTGALVYDAINVNSLGHLTSVNSRTLTPANIGAMSTWVTAPATPTSAGTAGQLAYDLNYLYLCVFTGISGSAKWIRMAGASWV